MSPPHHSLLQILLRHRWISEHQVRAISSQFPAGMSPLERDRWVVEQLVARDWVKEEDLISFFADQNHVDWFRDLPECDLADLRGMMRGSALHRAVGHGWIPVGKTGNCLIVASLYPCDWESIDAFALELDCSARIKLLGRGLFERLRDKVCDGSCPSGLDPDRSADSGNRSILEDPAVHDRDHVDLEAFLNWVFLEAVRLRASDIHLEPEKGEFQVRFRIDGELRCIDRSSLSLHQAAVSGIKLMADMDIGEKRLPQDGRFHRRIKDAVYDFRVSILPSTNGESIVIRILQSHLLQKGLSELGMSPLHQEIFERVIESPDGLFLVTGPTGSGKSTTLYTALQRVNRSDRKILTVEDPVEYHLKGVNQVPVDGGVGMSFSSVLRAMLRQAPDILMVGEIRDRETAEVAIHASLTGHVVYSTLHTNDAPGAITRLLEMQVKPYLLASALRAVLAQRLVRRIAADQAIPYPLSRWQTQMLGPDVGVSEGQTFFRAGHSGRAYWGRLGVFEMFEVDKILAEMIYRSAGITEIKSHLKSQQFVNLQIDGVHKARCGLTTLEEILTLGSAEGSPDRVEMEPRNSQS